MPGLSGADTQSATDPDREEQRGDAVRAKESARLHVLPSDLVALGAVLRRSNEDRSERRRDSHSRAILFHGFAFGPQKAAIRPTYLTAALVHWRCS